MSLLLSIERQRAIAAQAFDLSDKDLGEVAIQRTESGWELKPSASTVRLDVAAK